jgi:DNA polymerase sigma
MESINQDHQEVYNKLHLEVLQFRDSVKEVLAEMQPLKEQLIENITSIIQKALPHSEVKVYGSHATKLCLPWSDIDLVIITNQSLSGIKGMSDHPKSVLSLINQELK